MTQAAGIEATGRLKRRRRRGRGHMPVTVMLSLGTLGVLALVAVFAPWLTPQDPLAQTLSERLAPPLSDGYPLGSDHLGRDILSRLIVGAQVSMAVAAAAVIVAGVIGTLLGMVGGYLRGPADAIISWIGSVQLSFPLLLIAVALAAVWGGSIYAVVVVLAATTWPTYARVARGQTLAVRESDYVAAAQVMYAPTSFILSRHLVPNIIGPVIAVAAIEAANVIILEASLSFLGLGVPPGTPSWGAMIAEGVAYSEVAPWITVYPGLVLTLTVLAINVTGNWATDRIAGAD